MSALAGGDCIDDADALRAGGTARVLGHRVKAASTLGTFLRSFRWGHVRQLDRVSRELLGRAWAAGAGPGANLLTIDLDSTICETYGLAKEGALHHGYTGVRGYHPLLAVAAGTGDVLNGPPARGSGQHRPGCRPLPARDDRPGPRCGRERAADRPGRQRLLCPRRRPGLPDGSVDPGLGALLTSSTLYHTLRTMPHATDQLPGKNSHPAGTTRRSHLDRTRQRPELRSPSHGPARRDRGPDGRVAVVEAARNLVRIKGAIAFLTPEKAMAWADLQLAIDALESS
jgi:Transposase DDE domain group 1